MELTPITSYHPHINRQTKVVNKWVESYPCNYVLGWQKAWVKWLHLGEFFCNSTFHMSIKMPSFMALYGYEAPNFVDLLFGDCRLPRAKDLQES